MTEETTQEELYMHFDTNTIQHLGIKMYSRLPPVMAEVVANSYDADAHEVTIFLDDREELKIEIVDDGHGMIW
ncbi:ATP-binding protein, partial [Chloroflexota bacterium]